MSELEGAGRRGAGWWGWSEGKIALEWLFWTGQITTHSRRRFERVYELTERALPSEVIATPTPALEEAQRALLRIAIRALGVATERDLRDYFRLTRRMRMRASPSRRGGTRARSRRGLARQAFLARRSVPPGSTQDAAVAPSIRLCGTAAHGRLFGSVIARDLYPASGAIMVITFCISSRRRLVRASISGCRPSGHFALWLAHCETDADAGARVGLARRIQHLPLAGSSV